MSITTPMKKQRSRSEDEVFSRLDVDSLVSLMLQSVQVAYEQDIVLSAAERNGKVTTNDCDRAYLLVDVRLTDNYAAGHITTAISYPHTLLSRQTIHPLMTKYKNRSGHLIVCYDEREFDAPRVVETLVQRGFDNVVLLSGGWFGIGLHHAELTYPDSLVVKQESAQQSKSKRNARPSSPHELPSELDDAAVTSLRAQLQQRLQPTVARGRLLVETASGRRNREANKAIIQANQQKLAPWK